MPKLLIKRKAYTRKDGTRVKAASFSIRDRGAEGRTPKSQRWFSPSLHTGWDKRLPAVMRRQLVLLAHKGDLLVAGRSLQALSNVTVDKKTKALAGLDARYFFRVHKRG